MSLVVMMLFLAALFFQLHAFFLGAIQILVYAGAVLVLFLFIIMLLDIKSESELHRRWWSLILGLVLALLLSYVWSQVLLGVPQGTATTRFLPDVGAEAADLGNLLFTKYILPFQVISVLLLVATVGVVLLSKRADKPETK
jgi:NADH-quinone oxidoreductase subunit J